jgi:hypothetical protein
MSHDTDESAGNAVTGEPGWTSTDDDAPTDASAGGPGGDEGEVRGTSDPGAKFREMEVSEEEQREIAEERERRLDPANRPPNAEVDNTDRTFQDGHFVD